MKSFAIIAVALLVAVASAGHLGCTAPETPVYNLVESTCPRVDYCYTQFCACLGGQYNNRTHACDTLNQWTDCDQLATCSHKNMRCLNEEAQIGLHEEDCKTWAEPVYQALLVATAAGQEGYINTTLAASCQYESCLWANKTQCAPQYATTCQAPPNYFGTIRLSGDWHNVINSTDRKRALKRALEQDLYNELNGADVSVFDVRLGSLIADFNILNADNTTDALITKAANSSSWLTRAKAAFTANGGEGKVEVSYMGTTVVETPTPETPEPTKTGGDDSGSKCGTGCVVGIIIGVIVFIVLVGAVVMMKGKKGVDGEESELTTTEGGNKYSTV